MRPYILPATTADTSAGPMLLLQAALLALAAWLIWRVAWVSDDAAITLRTVLNLLTDHGARFNVDERVQAYTHPLWFGLLALATLLTANAFLAAVWLGIVLSVAGLAGLMLLAIRPWQGLLAVAALLASTAFVEFSTSGLENPLSHLLIVGAGAALLAVYDVRADGLRRIKALKGFFLCAGLLLVCRMDLGLLLAPSAVSLLLAGAFPWGTRWRALASGAIPVLLWTLLALLYYGTPLPNTAFAKLDTGIARADLLQQGVRYFENTLANDPLTLGIVAAGLLLAPLVRGLGWGWALGLALYLGYVASVGGDFMAGRFFTAPAVAGALVLARVPLPPLAMGLLAAAGAVLGWSSAADTAQLAQTGQLASHQVLDAHGIADERSFYFRTHALANIAEQDLALFRPNRWRPGAPQTSVACGGLGWASIRQGPGTHFIDTCALADPLLSRLPVRGDRHWRIGHFERAVPAGYAESVTKNANLLTDPQLRERYEKIRRITRAPLWNEQRLRDIVTLNRDWVRTRLGSDP